MLGPLLFILYVNDLDKCQKFSKAILYADDTTIYVSGENLDEIKQEIEYDLNILSDWFMTNKLSLNISETHFMQFNYGNNNPLNILNFGNNNEIKM